MKAKDKPLVYVGIVFGILIGFVLGAAWQDYMTADRLEEQVRTGVNFCHSDLHGGGIDDTTWLDESWELRVEHAVIHCGWVGDVFQPGPY